MIYKSYDWVNDEESRYDLAAAAVVVLFTERTMKTMNFEKFHPLLKESPWRTYAPEDRNKCQSYLKCLKAAVELAHKNRTGKDLNLEKYALKEDYFKLYDLVLRVYSRLKSSGNTP